MRLPLWGSWHRAAMTERASRLSQSRCAAISRLFVRAMLSLCQCFSGSILALSVCFAATSPKGRGTGEEGNFPVCQSLPSIGATTTTAASGGNREELLGQRPAGCKRQRSRRWEPQPGLWHAAGVTERFSSRWRVELNQKNDKYQKFPANPSKHFLNEESWIFPLRQRKSVTIAADAALGSAAHGEEGEREKKEAADLPSAPSRTSLCPAGGTFWRKRSAEHRYDPTRIY